MESSDLLNRRLDHVKVYALIATIQTMHSIGDSERLAMDMLNESFGKFSHTNPTQMEKGYSLETVTP
jgi:hypothetical protein